jgi:hypothetical protein
MSKILIDAAEAGDMLGLGERAFHKLLKRHPELAAQARVVLSARAVRYRVAVLAEFVANLGPFQPLPEPDRLARGREARRARLEAARAGFR